MFFLLLYRIVDVFFIVIVELAYGEGMEKGRKVEKVRRVEMVESESK